MFETISDTTKVLLIEQDKSSLSVWLPTILPALVSIIAVLITTWFSIRAIRRTAETNRVSNIHFELYKCVSETFRPLSEMIRLLEDVAHGTVYLEEGKMTGTGYERFKERIEDLSKEYNFQLSQHELILPERLFERLRSLIIKINSAKKTAMLANPFKSDHPMDAGIFEKSKKILQPEVSEIIRFYEDLVNEARKYLGIETMKPITDFSELKLLLMNKDLTK